MKKVKFYTETAYLIGIFLIAFGTALMAKADIGISIVAAPAYLLHLKISETFSFFTFGMAEYILQGCLLIILSVIIREFRISFLLSFVTAIFYGFVLDLCSMIVNIFTVDAFIIRVIFYIAGYLVCMIGVAFIFHTYIPPEAYDLFVKEVSAKFNCGIGKAKMLFDCTYCVFGIILSFAFYGWWHFEGVKAGTAVCALFGGFILSSFSKIVDKFFRFEDKFNLRKYIK